MKLFWKIFIAFGIAMAITLVVAVSVSFRLIGQAFDQFNIENREDIIQQAAAALDSGGETGLRVWLSDRPRPIPGIELMIVDDQGIELLDRDVPPRYARFLRPRPSRFRGAPRNIRPIQLTPELLGPDGREYRLLFVRTRITVLGVLTWPATQVAVLTLVLLAAAVTSLPLARYLSSPIGRLRKASRALADGALDTRVGGPVNRRKDEVGTLARDFDAMAERIQALVTDKETLLRDVSHEFRSPLARIRVALALAERKAGPDQRADLERIEREAERLDDLVGRIMTLARLRSPMRPKVEPLDLGELVGEVVDNARFEHPRMAIDYRQPDMPSVHGNAVELRSAIENALRNAVAHTGEDGRIEIDVQETSGQVAISVKDRGPGVPENELGKIFEPFYRADPSRNHREDGQGIGLAIVASVMSRHRGSAVASNRPGGGLELRLRFPLQRPEAG